MKKEYQYLLIFLAIVGSLFLWKSGYLFQIYPPPVPADCNILNPNPTSNACAGSGGTPGIGNPGCPATYNGQNIDFCYLAFSHTDGSYNYIPVQPGYYNANQYIGDGCLYVFDCQRITPTTTTTSTTTTTPIPPCTGWNCGNNWIFYIIGGLVILLAVLLYARKKH